MPRNWADFNRSVPYYQPLIDRVGGRAEGDFEGHWLVTVFRLGWIGDVPAMRELGHQAVKDILGSLDESGYIGTDSPAVRFKTYYSSPFYGTDGGAVEGPMEVLYAFLTYYRFTGDAKVLEAVVKAANLVIEKTGEDVEWGNLYRLAPLGFIELYRVTGNKAYLDRARATVDRTLPLDIKQKRAPSLAEKLKDGEQIHGHTATTGEYLWELAGLYEISGDPEMLAKARTMSGVSSGSAPAIARRFPTGQGRISVPSSPHANTEIIVTSFAGIAWVELLKSTGEARYADLAEKAALNALPGQRSKDGAVSAYFSRPNQLFATRGWGSSLVGTVYSVIWLTECCHSQLGPAHARSGREHRPGDTRRRLCRSLLQQLYLPRPFTPSGQRRDRAGDRLSIFRDGQDSCAAGAAGGFFCTPADTGVGVQALSSG